MCERIRTASGKCGSGRFAAASASSSRNLCPLPRKKRSACAGFTYIASFIPASGCSAGSASMNEGRGSGFAAPGRDHGISIVRGSGIATTPTAPAARSAFHRSSLDCACAISALGIPFGPPRRYTATLPCRSTFAKSLYFSSGAAKP
jgi:hypothetical protein